MCRAAQVHRTAGDWPTQRPGEKDKPRIRQASAEYAPSTITCLSARMVTWPTSTGSIGSSKARAPRRQARSFGSGGLAGFQHGQVADREPVVLDLLVHHHADAVDHGAL